VFSFSIYNLCASRRACASREACDVRIVMRDRGAPFSPVNFGGVPRSPNGVTSSSMKFNTNIYKCSDCN